MAGDVYSPALVDLLAWNTRHSYNIYSALDEMYF